MLLTVTPSQPPVKGPRRSYRSPLRAERAQANRRAIVEAARDLFLERGYVRTSVAAIAARAQVSADLVYKQFETKRGVLVEVLNFVVTGVTDGPPVLEQRGPQVVRAETDQRRQIAMFAADVAGRISRARPIDDVFRSAAQVDEEIAAKWADLHETRWRTLRGFVGWLAANGPLRDGMGEEDAATTIWTLTSPDVHRLLVDVRGWGHERYAGWLEQNLATSLLPPP